LTTAESYNPATNAWSPDPSMPTARADLAVAAAPCPTGQTGTCVYAAGGETTLTPTTTATVESFNPTTNAWSTDASLPTSRYGLAAASAACPAGQTGTCVYAIGGLTANGINQALTGVSESYNPATNAWSTDASMPTARGALAAASAPCPAGQTGACVYAFGGITSVDVATFESYNRTTNAWTTLPSMPTARDLLAGASAPCPPGETGTCIYAAGGNENGTVLATVQAFDPPPSSVWSDSIRFAGPVKPGPTPGSFTFQSATCSLVSDGENVVFPCRLAGQVSKSSTGAVTGTAQAASADGRLNWTFTLIPVPGTKTWKMSGPGVENDAPDPGGPSTKPYAAAFMGQLTFNASHTAVHGAIQVRESSTAP
jgi:kelch-like protein 8/kelch-like protein 20